MLKKKKIFFTKEKRKNEKRQGAVSWWVGEANVLLAISLANECISRTYIKKRVGIAKKVKGYSEFKKYVKKSCILVSLRISFIFFSIFIKALNLVKVNLLLLHPLLLQQHGYQE